MKLKKTSRNLTTTLKKWTNLKKMNNKRSREDEFESGLSKEDESEGPFSKPYPRKIKTLTSQ